MSQSITVAWRHYRIGKMFGAVGEMLDRLIFFTPEKKTQKQVSYPSDYALRREPRAGSTFWSTCVEPPVWFRDELTEGDVAVMLAMAQKPKIRTKRQKRRVRRKK